MSYKIFIPMAAALLACMGLVACVDFNDATGATSVRIRLVQPAEFVNETSLADKTITLQFGNQTLSTTTDAQGIATFVNVTPDVYGISTSWAISGEEYDAAMGIAEAVSGASITGAINSRFIRGEETIDLQTYVSPDRDLVIGKVYYAGSKNNDNRTYMYGKYIEIFNQSDDSIDVSGLYIGLTEAESKQAWTLTALASTYGQDSVIMLKQIYRIPADKPYWVEPGGTVIICNSAIDHTDNNDLDHNLIDADFEVKDSQGRHTNNPATPALEMIYQIYAGTTVMNLPQSGPVGVVIFRSDEAPSTWEATYAYGKTAGLQWVALPVGLIIDGFEALSNKSTGIDVATKRLWDKIDSGYTYINAASGWTGETVYRRTLKVQDGRKVLVDTNNSSNDFKVSATIQPRQYDDAE